MKTARGMVSKAAATGMSILCASLLSVTASFAAEVGVVWKGKSGMAERVLAGVQERLGEDSAGIKLEIHKAVESDEEFEAIIEAYQDSKQGMIVMRSNGARYLGQNPPSIPAFIGAANHPQALGTISNMDAPEGNITGVTYYLPLEGPLQSFMTMAPGVESFLLFTQHGHPSSAIDWNGTKEACDAIGIKCAQATATDHEQLAAIMEREAGNYDAFILGNQNVIFSGASIVIESAAAKPVFSYAEKGVTDGALGGIAASDHKLGRMLAESVIAVLVDDKPVSAVPVKTDPEPSVLVNMKTASELGIEIPFQVLNSAKIIE